MNAVKRRVRAYWIPVLLLAVACLWTTPEKVQAAGNDTTIFSYLTINMDLTPAAACGIMANMYEESHYIPDIANPSGAYGLCQWMGPRLTRLKNYCAQHKLDYKTVAGQVRFLNYELQTYFPNVLSHMRGIKNTAAGAYDAGYYWCYYFEIPGNRTATSTNEPALLRTPCGPNTAHRPSI